MADVIRMYDLDARVAKKRARVITTLRELAARLEAAPAPKLCQTLPIVASTMEELERRVALLLRLQQ
jgi:hypothetical protein